ncbi:MAG: hormogonium polysaccharide biosynthesis protein HpsA [Kastovskya adunca ATA6-11-RM4]|jgi:type II secretory pathway pseudopilin PulG|nr:hormogonium polysaccharide biosynthesis protein HpsA [Kastovskya adunca ATA6-11-RM4]
MSRRKKPVNTLQKIFQHLLRLSRILTKGLMNWLLRSLMLLGRRRSSNLGRAGFVLPTVIMVMLVVILLTTAIMIRSFDRSKNASNYRVNEAVLNATQPALDRAKAKINRLFSVDETNRQGNTPPEFNIADILEEEVGSEGTYTFGDEIQLQLEADFDGTAGINTNEETLKSAWKFPVDTDNNGRFDSYTLYGIYFRYPEGRKKGPLEARALPMSGGATGCSVGAGNIAGWFSTGGKSKKAFFTYVATVPITEEVTTAVVTDSGRSIPPTQFETYRGNRGFSALELQQDQARIALDNNAIWFDDDIQVSNAPTFRVNGRIHTNGNLMLRSANPLELHQVSSAYSCYYDPDNAKIVVAGNVATGDIRNTDAVANDNVKAYLYRGQGVTPGTSSINDKNKTTTALGGATVAYNKTAYDQRIGVMVRGALNLYGGADPAVATVTEVNAVGRYPQDLKDFFKRRFDASGEQNLENVLESYFKQRTRRVPYAEVPLNGIATAVKPATTAKTDDPASGDFVFGSAGEIKPPPEWMLIADPGTGAVGNYTNLALRINATDAQPMDLEAVDPDKVAERKESLIGDRILVGNNLPYRWYNGSTFQEPGIKQDVFSDGSTTAVAWNKADGTADTGNQRKRPSRVQILDDLGDTSRNGFWERAAAKNSPAFDQEQLSGGLRVVTGAGIYIDGLDQGTTGTGIRGTNSFLPAPPTVAALTADGITGLPTGVTDANVVWPDTMPMYKDDGDNIVNATDLKGDLQMRATVVYHYAANKGKDQTPIACINSYYDPTTEATAGAFNNGKNYPIPARDYTNARLVAQSKMVFPDGRWANKPLYDALNRAVADRTLADNAAVDSALCALSILDGAAATPVPAGTAGKVADGAIKEATFLDARQVKALHKPKEDATGNPIADATTLANARTPEQLRIAKLGALTTDYDLPIEQRQPLEIRVTEIDLNSLRTTTIGLGEYLLPNSGIIYATRDDALPDISAGEGKLEGATDFKLDPTRRPNGIRLINGRILARGANNAYNADEKGLILASDLPVYIKGEFNLHQEFGTTTRLEEFKASDALAANYNNFYTRGSTGANNNRNDKFACRQNQQGCSGNGDQWRAVRILSDAVTLLSGDFKDGVRSNGSYDVNNNAGNLAVEKRLKNGFWWNGFATSRPYWNTTPNSVPEPTTQLTSYLANGVTPIQRRVNFPEYRMEICRKLPVSECTPTDWDLAGAGTTATPPAALADQIYPRRVAFDRDPVSKNLLPVGGPYRPLGVGCPTTGCIYGGTTVGTNYGTPNDNALWFWTTNSTTNPGAIGDRVYTANRPLFYLPPADLNNDGTPDPDGQPLLVPVLQLHSPNGAPGNNGTAFNGYINDSWMQRATETRYNGVFVMGDSPARPANASYEAETGGGLVNFPRFLEAWEAVNEGAPAAARINGSFIQFKKSLFATAPFEAVDSFTVDNSLFFDGANPDHTSANFGGLNDYRYRGGGASRRAPYYRAPDRAWGYDVGLLSQTPDLFSKRFASPDVGTPNEYYREVGRDDPWVESLLCGVHVNDPDEPAVEGLSCS